MRKPPERRALRIFAFDPMISRAGDHRITVEVPYRTLERTERSFWDDRLEVIDYDAAATMYYRAVNLDDAAIAQCFDVSVHSAAAFALKKRKELWLEVWKQHGQPCQN